MHEDLQDLQQKMAMLSFASFQKEELFLNVSLLEVYCTLQRKMKLKMAWQLNICSMGVPLLLYVLNSIELEQIPVTQGITTPVYKGGG